MPSRAGDGSWRCRVERPCSCCSSTLGRRRPGHCHGPRRMQRPLGVNAGDGASCLSDLRGVHVERPGRSLLRAAAGAQAAPARSWNRPVASLLRAGDEVWPSLGTARAGPAPWRRRPTGGPSEGRPSGVILLTPLSAKVPQEAIGVAARRRSLAAPKRLEGRRWRRTRDAEGSAEPIGGTTPARTRASTGQHHRRGRRSRATRHPGSASPGKGSPGRGGPSAADEGRARGRAGRRRHRLERDRAGRCAARPAGVEGQARHPRPAGLRPGAGAPSPRRSGRGDGGADPAAPRAQEGEPRAPPTGPALRSALRRGPALARGADCRHPTASGPDRGQGGEGPARRATPPRSPGDPQARRMVRAQPGRRACWRPRRWGRGVARASGRSVRGPPGSGASDRH